MFEITPEDIAQLDDADTRTLVGHLCVSEMRKRGLPVSAVTYGGHQDAPDGGVDVRVDLPDGTEIEGFVSRAATCLQVKKPDMQPAEIRDEMRPSGVIRPAIAELAARSGAYVIVSTGSNLTDTMRQARLAAMRDAVNDVPNAAALHVDIIDRTRLAAWVEEHPSRILWVRERIGRAFSGWQPYGPWAYPHEGLEAEYLIDSTLRIETGRREDGDGLDAMRAIRHIRNLLRQPGRAARIVGLSGVGKTRFVQALFDERVGEQALDPALAFYTDMGRDPDPVPLHLASNLVATGTRAVLIVDNCGTGLHRQLVETCSATGSMLSIVTVEYDIREDDPEGTEVFKLEPSSGELIGKLVRQRFTGISDVDVATIAEVSGGNARIAIAIANTVGRNESLAGLTEEDLFQRLFLQRHAADTSLYLAAQACALVYSFQGEPDADGSPGDLARLGFMVGMDADTMHRHVAELKGRDLVQARSIWRALLPHAVANRMAALALRNIRYETIESAILTGAPERLLKSFSRRLGYLHRSPEAVATASRWLAPGGVLADIAGYDALKMAVFRNIAPVAPEAALAALENVPLSSNGIERLPHREEHIRLLRSLAYEAPLFGRGAALLSLLAEEGGETTYVNGPLDTFVSLFHLYLSGTHATAAQRLDTIKAGLSSDRPAQSFIAMRALHAMLEATHFSSHYSFDFGARPRDYGFCPRTEEDVQAWFSPVLKFIEGEVTSGNTRAMPLLGVLASQFRGLWRVALIRDDLERICRAAAERHFWREGWLALRSAIYFDAEGAPPNVVVRLKELEKILRPKDLEQRVRGIVLAKRLTGIDTEDYEEFEEFDGAAAGESSEERLAALLRGLGHAVAEDIALFDKLLPELLAGQGRIVYFGEGLAERAGDPRAMWEKIIGALKTMEKEKHRHPLLWGFLRGLGKENRPLVDEFLDLSLQDDFLFSWYPGLQTAVKVDERGMARLMQSLDSPQAKAENYDIIHWNEDWIMGTDLGRLLQKIATMPDSSAIVADKLDMRLFVDNRDKRAHAPELVEVGRELLRAYVPAGRNDNEDRELQRIVHACLHAPEDAGIVRDICHRLKDAAERYATQPYAHDDLLQGLLKVHPLAVLDGFFAGDEDARKEGLSFFESLLQARKNPIDVVPKETLAQWCDQAPDIRYPVAASIISPFSGSRDEAGGRNWSETALYLLERAPDRLAIMRRYIYRFAPMSWSGSRAAIMELNARLLDDLLDHPFADVRDFAASEKPRFAGLIEEQRRAEAERSRREDERFED